MKCEKVQHSAFTVTSSKNAILHALSVNSWVSKNNPACSACISPSV